MARLIDGDALIAWIKGSQQMTSKMKSIICYIKTMPTIEARPKGEWIDMGDFEQCSVCKGTHLKEVQTYYGKATWIKTDFCSNCGADMREREGE